MISPSKFKSRTFRRVKKVTPGNRNIIHFVRRKPGKAVCAVYGTKLHGVASDHPKKMQNMPKSSKRPERPFAGILSSKAMREVMKEKARSMDK